MSLSKEEAKRLLERQISTISLLRTKSHYPPQFEPWREQSVRIIKRIFGERSDHQRQFKEISYGLSLFTESTPDSVWEEAYQRGLTKAEFALKSFVEELDLFQTEQSLSCPKCGAIEAQYLEIDEVGSKKYKLAIPRIAGVQWKSGKKAAYFMCKKCQTAVLF